MNSQETRTVLCFVCAAFLVFLFAPAAVAGHADEGADTPIPCVTAPAPRPLPGCLESVAPFSERSLKPVVPRAEIPSDPDAVPPWALVLYNISDHFEWTPTTCLGGPNHFMSCARQSECPGGSCEVVICVGGLMGGTPCDLQDISHVPCPGGECVWLNEALETENVDEEYRPGDSGCFPDPCESGLKLVWGADDRTKISGTTSKPWRRIGRLRFRFPNDPATHACTGALISPSLVLTAGHCVHEGAGGSWANWAEFSPGQNASSKPYGTVSAVSFGSFHGWTDHGKTNHDMGVVFLGSKIGNSTGWFGFSTGGASDVGRTRNLAGYPHDKPWGTMWYDAGEIKDRTTYKLKYKIDTEHGQSGSPVWRYLSDTGQRWIRADHRGSSGNYNEGVRITGSKFNSLLNWKESTMKSLPKSVDDPCQQFGCDGVNHVPDCNENRLPDACDLDCGALGGACNLPGCGWSYDANGNGIPDECEGACCFSDGSCGDTLSGLECLLADPAAFFVEPGAVCLGDGDNNGIDDLCQRLSAEDEDADEEPDMD
jgi:V8-like Glu-specific endopeptidase